MTPEEEHAADQMRRDVLYPCHMCGGSVSAEAVERYKEAKRCGNLTSVLWLHCGQSACPKVTFDGQVPALHVPSSFHTGRK